MMILEALNQPEPIAVHESKKLSLIDEDGNERSFLSKEIEVISQQNIILPDNTA